MADEGTVLTANDDTAADDTANNDSGMVDAKDLNADSITEEANKGLADQYGKDDDQDKGDQDKGEGEDKSNDSDKDDDKSDDESKDDDKKSDVPETYELKLSDKSLLTDESVAKIAEIAKEQQWSQEQAEAALEIADSQVAAFKEGVDNKSAELSEQWRKQSENDSEFGGEAFKANADLAARAINKFASPEFKEMLGKNGFGNHPEVVRTFVRIGKAMHEDSFENGDKGGDQVTDTASKLYPDAPKS